MSTALHYTQIQNRAALIYMAGDWQQYQRTKLSGYTCLEEIASRLTQFSCLCLNDNIDQLCV